MTNLQLHYDEANVGRCLICGCTVNSRVYYCRRCVAAAVKEMLKGKVAEGDPAHLDRDERAWQLQVAGEKVCQVIPKECRKEHEKFYYAYKDGYSIFYNADGTVVYPLIKRNHDEFIDYAKSFPNFDWTIYEEPKLRTSAYQVDDWVEVESGEHCLISMVGQDLGSGYCYYFKNSATVLYESSIVRKLKANEVVVEFGSFRGTVKLNSHPFGKQVTVKDTQGYAMAYISISHLDTHTRELVESLLKRIEDE